MFHSLVYVPQMFFQAYF